MLKLLPLALAYFAALFLAYWADSLPLFSGVVVAFASILVYEVEEPRRNA